MSNRRGWITPFMKQSFVTTGVTLNLAGHGISNGFTAVLLPQLRSSDSAIPIDDSSGSWIAAVAGFSLVGGNLLIPLIMAKYGRRTANMASLIPMLLGWICTVFATNVSMLIFARLLQGLSMGMGTTLGPVLIGEYTSPKNRGAFLTVISVMISIGVLIVHALGSYLPWQTAAAVCVSITLVDFIIVLLSPESPSWLADRGKHEECTRVFRWLRGDDEEHELHRMIEATSDKPKIEIKTSPSAMQGMISNLKYMKAVLKRKKFYEPIIIMIHIYTLSQWAGVNMLSTYTIDVLNTLMGDDINVTPMVLVLDAQRILSNIIGVYFIKKLKRRTMLIAISLLTIFTMSSTAIYSYLKENQIISSGDYIIEMSLLHIHMISVGLGTLPICYIIAGELFPLEFRSLAGGISVLSHSVNFFIVLKTVPYLFSSIGLHGTYLLYTIIVAYCLVVSWWYLPETKDRTLQEIEDEFRGPAALEKAMQLLPLGATVSSQFNTKH